MMLSEDEFWNLINRYRDRYEDLILEWDHFIVLKTCIKNRTAEGDLKKVIRKEKKILEKMKVIEKLFLSHNLSIGGFKIENKEPIYDIEQKYFEFLKHEPHYENQYWEPQ